MNTRSKAMTLLTLCLVLLAWLGPPVSTQAQSGATLQVYISTFPRLPSTQDFVSFYAFLLDDVSQTEVTYTWDFGDGTTASGQLTGHHYAAEGDYVVRLAVTTADGRSGSAARTITVRDRDVAVTKLTAPQAARAGQTRQVSIGVTGKRHDSWVSVILFNSDWTAKNLDQARAFAVAYLRGARDYHDAMRGGVKRNEVVEILMKYTTLKEPEQYSRIQWEYVDQNAEINVASMRDQQDWYAAQGTVTQKVDVESMIDRRFVDHAIGKLGRVAN